MRSGVSLEFEQQGFEYAAEQRDVIETGQAGEGGDVMHLAVKGIKPRRARGTGPDFF